MLVSPTEEEYDFLFQRLRERMDENQGETIYIIGIGGNFIFLISYSLLARLLILIKKGGLLQLKFGGVGVNIYLWAR